MRAALEKLRLWRADPVEFVRDNFKAEPDMWQRKALEAFASQKREMLRICLAACAGPGKSTVLVWMGWNFISCYGDKGEHPKGLAMSITFENLQTNMWSEFAKWQSRSPFLMEMFTHTSEKIFNKQFPKTWFISARSIPKKANTKEIGRVLSGLHSKYILYLIDESGDVPPQVLQSAEQGLSTGPVFGKIIQAGNPTSQTGMLYAASTKFRDKLHRIRITGDPDDPDRSPRIDIEWAREQIRIYGRTDPWVISYILGEFPPGGINVLLTVEQVEEAFGKHLSEDKYSWSQKRLGVDVARFGPDSTVIFPRQGLASFRPVEMRGARTEEIAARVISAKENWGSEVEYVDGTGGWGAGVIDNMIVARKNPVEVNFSGRADDPRYFNKRSEIWFRMAEWIKKGGALPKVQRLIAELTTPTYFMKNGKFALEEKDQIKKRLNISPDFADALALTFTHSDSPGMKTLDGNYIVQSKSSVIDYNPYDTDRLRRH